jgi:hypothetical protein
VLGTVDVDSRGNGLYDGEVAGRGPIEAHWALAAGHGGLKNEEGKKTGPPVARDVNLGSLSSGVTPVGVPPTRRARHELGWGKTAVVTVIYGDGRRASFPFGAEPPEYHLALACYADDIARVR